MRLIAEATVGGQLKLGAPKPDVLQAAIYAQLRDDYVRSANWFLRQIGSEEEFVLRAKWKERDLRRKAKLMADSLSDTVQGRRASILDLPDVADREKARSQFERHKLKQFNELCRAEGEFQAQVDIVVHSGAADVEKAQVMWFIGDGPDPCDICVDIEVGNPYTVRQATTLGAAMHPNCLCQWEMEEVFGADLRRRVRDGEVEPWTGQGRTPAEGRVEKRLQYMQERKGGWKGRITEQRRVVTERRAKRRKERRYPEMMRVA